MSALAIWVAVSCVASPLIGGCIAIGMYGPEGDGVPPAAPRIGAYTPPSRKRAPAEVSLVAVVRGVIVAVIIAVLLWMPDPFYYPFHL